MHLPIAQEFGVLEAWNHAQHSRLLTKAHVILESDQIVAVRPRAFLAKLHHGVRPLPRPGVDEAHGLHRSESQGVAAAARDLLDRKAGLEETNVIFRDVRRNS